MNASEKKISMRRGSKFEATPLRFDDLMNYTKIEKSDNEFPVLNLLLKI